MKNESKIIEQNTYCWACSMPSATYDFQGITTCGECGANKEPQKNVPVVSTEKQIAFLLLGIVAIVAFVALLGGIMMVFGLF